MKASLKAGFADLPKASEYEIVLLDVRSSYCFHSGFIAQ